MTSSTATNLMPVVSKMFCSSYKVAFMVRNRPRVVNGGGFAVLNHHQQVVFKADGCGTLGIKGELILRDGDGASLLFLRRKGGMIQALSAHRQWRGYISDYQGEDKKLVFSLKEPTSWAFRSTKITVSIEPKGHDKNWDFEIQGSFVDRACCIIDRRGNVVAQVGTVEGGELVGSRDVYRVVVQPGIDQAFVFGVIAVIDNIYNQSTAC